METQELQQQEFQGATRIDNSVPPVRVFYSRHGGLTMVQDPGRYITGVDGRTSMIGFREIAFTRQADGYGRFVTTDPEQVAFLDKRAREKGDVFSPDEYTRRTTPDNIRAAMAVQENARLISTNNALLTKQAELERQLVEVTERLKQQQKQK